MSVDTVRPPLTTLRREFLPLAAVPAVDGALKLLRGAAKRVQAVEEGHAAELAILRRLHYKNRNQHRISLFWRRVEEVKRLASRLEQVQLGDLVHWVRLGFHPEPSSVESSTQTLFKGAWTRLPDAYCLTYALEHIRGVATLVDAARARYASAYKLLSRTAAGGAFLGMMLVLCAIIARLDILLVELRDALQATWSALHSVFLVLPNACSADGSAPKIFPPEPGLTSLEPEITIVDTAEDLGVVVHRELSFTEHTSSAGIFNPPGERTFTDETLPHEPPIVALPLAEPVTAVPTPTIQLAVKRKAVHDVNVDKVEKKKKHKKKQQSALPKDEIDLIFG
ncbi:hypothetical protein BKA62DRAFT_625359 [Auriculariales sp. MPI-PUGE-AT-0066]|nr:hypothetical protein BKA62DRAFT_625359 [Auriculariales sp. MPI-PUGE-AT-0066]